MSLILRRFKQQAKERLQTEEGKRFRFQQLVEAEAVFRQVKHNRGFHRFLLRGTEKLNAEWGLITTGDNVAKMAV